MALHADTVWEMQTGGSNENGGGFYDRDPGTSVDYSQQETAQLSLSDLVMTTGGTTLTSATGGFTAAMVGNLIHINSGTNFTAGWYEITAYTDTNTVTLDQDVTNGSNASSGAGKVGGCVALPTNDLWTACAGHIMYQQAGTYTLTATVDVIGNSGPGHLIGYGSSRGDDPSGDNRPYTACGAYHLMCYFGGYGRMSHMRFMGTGTRVLRNVGYYVNCRSENTSATAGRNSIDIGYGRECVSCESVAANGMAFTQPSSFLGFINCCAHDSAYGFVPRSQYLVGCVAAGCTYGSLGAAWAHGVYLNCTFYNNTTGLRVYTGSSARIENCIFADNSSHGVYNSGTSYRCLLLANNWHSNGTDIQSGGIAIVKSPNATAHDPDFEDAANGDFRLKADSPCCTNGWPITLATGGNSITTHQGAVPPDASSGAGGTDAGPFDQQFVR